MSDLKRILLLNKIKNKTIIFEHIQGLASHRHYILPFLFDNDKILSSQLKNMIVISKQNKLSSTFMDNIFTFISDKILYDIINKEDIFNNDQYYDDKEEKNVVNIYQNRIKYIHKNGIYNNSKISNRIIEQYYPNDKDFCLFFYDFLCLQKTIYKRDNAEKIEQILSENLHSIKEEYDKYISNEKIFSFYQKKININIVFIGMEHAGKSTTIGHLLYSAKNLDDFQEKVNPVYGYNADSFRYAWIMDKSKLERESRHTIRISSRKLETQKYYFSLIDIQGKKNLIKNAIKGIFQGDAAVIIVPADSDAIKNIFSDNESFKDQIIAAFTMGIKQVIVAINKMDLCNYSEKIYIEIKEKMQKFLERIGFVNIRYVCYSGITGQNVVNRYEDDDLYKSNNVNKTPWYKGKTLLEELEQLKQPERLINKPLRISIFDYKRIIGIGWIFIGIIKTGILKTDTPISLSWPFLSDFNNDDNECIKIKCQSIKKYDEDLDMAFPGDIVGIRINRQLYSGYAFQQFSLIGNYGDDLSSEIVNFTADIVVINFPNSIKVGCCPIMFCHTKHICVKIIKLLYKVDKRTNKIIENNPIEIKNGEKAVVLFELRNLDEKNRKKRNIYKMSHNLEKYEMKKDKYFTFETYKENSFFGRIIIMDNNNIIAVGKIIEINKKKSNKK
jgi:elongation factor 1-alpha